jgi:hypothetical protein
MKYRKIIIGLLLIVLISLGFQYIALSLGEGLLALSLLFGAYLTKSATKFFTSIFFSVLLFSFIHKLISETFFATPLNKLGAVFPLVIIVIFLCLNQLWSYQTSLKSDLISLGSATSVFFLGYQTGLTKPGGSIAALFIQEDNAAWVLAASRVQHTSDNTIGIFGPLVDVLFFISHSISNNLFQNLGDADHVANAITLTYIIIPMILPFLCNAAIIRNVNGKSPAISLLLLQTGTTFIWFHFQQSGHLTAGLTSTGLLLLLVRIASLQSSPSQNTSLTRINMIVFLIVIGQTWFPIIPLGVALILMVGSKQLTPVGSRRRGVFACAVFGSIFLIVTEALPRFSTFRDENGGLFSGAANLLLMEGGAAGTEPLTAVVGLLILIGIALFILSTNEINVAKLVPLTYFWTFLFLMKITNVYLTGGTVNYGVRKIESMMILVSVVYCLWTLSMEVGVLHTKKMHIFLIGIPALSLMFQLGVVNQIIGKNLFPGLKNTRNTIIAQAISNTVSNGVSAVCINEQHQNEPFSELRMVAYVCSRFVSAYGNRDDLEKNEWRKAVLGAIRYEELPKVKEGLGDEVLLIRVGPANSDLTNNVDWTQLVNPNWRQVFAND